MEQRPDIKIVKAGNVEGGFYNEVRISGGANVNGDIDCVVYDINGASNVKGSVKSKAVKLSGMTQISGDLTSEKIETLGNAEIRGALFGGDVKVEGHLGTGLDLNAKELYAKGGITVKGNINTDKYTNDGSFKINGSINAKDVNLSLSAESSVKEINCEKLKVVKPNNFSSRLQSLFQRSNGHLTVDTIEGSEILLEATTANLVKGDKVKVGKDCIIETVEYTESIEIVDGAVVKNQKKA